MAGKYLAANAAKQRAWIDLCGFEPAYSGAVPAASRAESSLMAVRCAVQGWHFRTRGIEIRPLIYVHPDADAGIRQAVKILFWNDDHKSGRPDIRLLPVTAGGAVDAASFAETVARDRSYGFSPMMAVGAFGADKTGATDPLADMARICAGNDMWLHIDAEKNGRFLTQPQIAAKFRAAFSNAHSVAAPDLFLTRFPSRLERGWGVKPEPVAEFNRAAANYTKFLERETKKEMDRPAGRRFIAKLGL